MFELGWDEGGAAWQWRCKLWTWEEELLAECRSLLYDISLQSNISDQWLWRHDLSDGYLVRGVYNLLTSQDSHGVEATLDFIWHQQVPLKVNALAWRLFCNTLPTKDNLVTRNIISHDSQFCVTGCGRLETTHHLFLSFPAFAPLWRMVRSWISISSAYRDSLHDHLVQFIHSSGGLWARRSFLQLIWLCCVCVMWNEWNNSVFKTKEGKHNSPDVR